MFHFLTSLTDIAYVSLLDGWSFNTTSRPVSEAARFTFCFDEVGSHHSYMFLNEVRIVDSQLGQVSFLVGYLPLFVESM